MFKMPQWFVVSLVSIVILNVSMNIWANPLKPIYFEFHHRETFAISDKDDNVKEQDYDYDDPGQLNDVVTVGSGHIRKRRSAKWSPDYDLYSQWAEEYYAEYKSAELTAGGDEKPKGDLLDQLVRRNITEGELQSEREWQKKKKERIEMVVVFGSWIIAILILLCAVKVYAKRVLLKLGCDFCDVFRFKNKMQHMVNNFVPGVYVHKNGKKEYYNPTDEELEALKQIQKLLYSVH